MSAHDDYVAKGYCDAIYVDEDDVEHWCKHQDDHLDPETNEPDKHVAVWAMEYPRQETMIRWLDGDDGPTDVEWVAWEPDPEPTSNPYPW